MRKDRKQGLVVLFIFACILAFAYTRPTKHYSYDDYFRAQHYSGPRIPQKFEGQFAGVEARTNVKSVLVIVGNEVSWYQNYGTTYEKSVCNARFVVTSIKDGSWIMQNPHWICNDSPVTENTILAYNKSADHWVIIDGDGSVATWTIFERTE